MCEILSTSSQALQIVDNLQCSLAAAPFQCLSLHPVDTPSAGSTHVTGLLINAPLS